MMKKIKKNKRTSHQAQGEVMMMMSKIDLLTGHFKRRETMKALDTKKTFLSLSKTDKRMMNVI